MSANPKWAVPPQIDTGPTKRTGRAVALSSYRSSSSKPGFAGERRLAPRLAKANASRVSGQHQLRRLSRGSPSEHFGTRRTVARHSNSTSHNESPSGLAVYFNDGKRRASFALGDGCEPEPAPIGNSCDEPRPAPAAAPANCLTSTNEDTGRQRSWPAHSFPLSSILSPTESKKIRPPRLRGSALQNVSARDLRQTPITSSVPARGAMKGPGGTSIVIDIPSFASPQLNPRVMELISGGLDRDLCTSQGQRPGKPDVINRPRTDHGQSHEQKEVMEMTAEMGETQCQ